MKKDIIKELQTELKQATQDDKLYLPIIKEFNKILKNIDPFVKSQSDLEHDQKSLFLQRKNNITMTHQELYDKYIRAFNVIVEKNSDEIAKEHQSMIDESKIVKQKYNENVKFIADERSSLIKKVEETIEDVAKKKNRELFDLEQAYKASRDSYLNIVDDIEKENKEVEASLKSTYSKKKEIIANQKLDNLNVRTTSIDQNTDQKNILTDLNGNNYVNIKKTFNETNVSINQKISSLNKAHQSALNKLDQQLDKVNDPIYKDLENLKTEHQQKIENLKLEYQSDLEKCDKSFETYLESYKLKKEKLIHETGENISIFNSKLTANRESIEQTKKEVVRDYRNQMKDSPEQFESSIASKMKKHLNQLDSELNKFIIQTQKDIVKMKYDYQSRLSDEEIKFLNRRHEWRLEKLMIANKHHFNLKKLDLNLSYNIDFAKQKEDLNVQETKIKKDILGHALNKDVLPLETQMNIQNLIQERELNLLNNDQEIALNQLKIELLHIEHSYEIANQELNFLESKNKLDLDSELLVLNSNSQLELEKAKLKREESAKDYQLRKGLAESLFEQQKNQVNYDYEFKSVKWHYDTEMADLNYQLALFELEHKKTLIYQKRSYFMRDADLKTKARIQINEAIKDIRNYAIDTDLLQNEVNHLINVFIFCHKTLLEVEKLINQTYHLPAHPDIFKKVLVVLKNYVQFIFESYQIEIDTIESKIIQYFEMQKNDTMRHKHSLRHETYQFFYQNNVDQFDIDMNQFEDEIKTIESKVLLEQSEYEKQQNFIIHLKNIKEQNVKGLINLSQQDIDGQDKLIKKHENIMKSILQKLKIYETQISRNHKAISKLSFKKQVMIRKIRLEDYRYKRNIGKDIKLYNPFISKFKKLFNNQRNHFQLFKDSYQVFDYYMLQNKFLAESQMKDLDHHFKKRIRTFADHIVVDQQKQLNLINLYYMTQLDYEAAVISDISKYEKYAAKLLKQSSTIFKLEMNQSQRAQTNLTTQSLKNSKKNLNHFNKTTALEFKKATQSIKQSITSDEDEISKLTKSIEQELNTINQNQHEIALQYMNDLNEKQRVFKEQYEKELKSLQNLFNKKIDDLKNSNEHIEKKNEMLLAKFKEKEKQVLSLKTQKDHQFQERITDGKKQLKALNQSYLKGQKVSLKRRDMAFNLLKQDLSKQNKLTTSKEQVDLNKAVKEEKQSYRFKIKTMNLD